MCGPVIRSTPCVWFTPDCPPSPSRKGRGVLAKSPHAYGNRFQNNVATVSPDIFVRLLRGWAPLLDDFSDETGLNELPAGAYLLRSELPWGLETISVWVGARITLMIDVNEQNILRHKLNLPWRDEEE